MSTPEFLAAALERVAAVDIDGGITGFTAAAAPMDEPRALAQLSYLRYAASDFVGARRDALEALAASSDADRSTRLLVLGAAGLALGADRSPASDLDGCFEEATSLLNGGTDLDPSIGWLLAYLLVEAAVVNARISLARQFVDALASALAQSPDRVFRGLVDGAVTRLLVYEGRVAEAESIAVGMFERASTAPDRLYASAVCCLVAGNRDARAETRALARQVGQALPEAAGAFRAVCTLLVAFGLAALADTRGAAALARSIGGDDFAELSLQDRAFAIEILVAGAIADGDVAEVERLIEQLADDVDRRIPGPAILRMQSRLALLHGDAGAALVLARTAADRASLDGRSSEVGAAEILATRALIARSDRAQAVKDLSALAHQAGLAGHTAAARAAARELKAIGRRLSPSRGSGWDALSPREREVALLSAEGNSTAQVASILQLSSRTVDAHLTRVLTAFGIVSRRQLPSRVASMLQPSAVQTPPARLTPRQHDLVELVADGLSNDEIATALGISRKTVEKHLSAVFDAWVVRSRVAVARIVLDDRAHRRRAGAALEASAQHGPTPR